MAGFHPLSRYRRVLRTAASGQILSNVAWPELTDQETFALLDLPTETIESDRYQFLPRVRTLRSRLEKFGGNGTGVAAGQTANAGR